MRSDSRHEVVRLRTESQFVRPCQEPGRIYNFWNSTNSLPFGKCLVVSTRRKFSLEELMRIGITCYPTYGGSGVVATELGIELASQGHQVHFISYSQPFRLNGREEGIFYHEVPVSSYPLFEFPPYDLALASRMAEVAEFCDLDLLHVHYAIPHSVSALLARQMVAVKGRKLPFVTTLHG